MPPKSSNKFNSPLLLRLPEVPEVLIRIITTLKKCQGRVFVAPAIFVVKRSLARMSKTYIQKHAPGTFPLLPCPRSWETRAKEIRAWSMINHGGGTGGCGLVAASRRDWARSLHSIFPKWLVSPPFPADIKPNLEGTI